MNCPACGNSLRETTVGEVTVDVCTGGCGGIWFDNFELEKFDESHESEGAKLLSLTRKADIEVDHRRERPCPRCRNTIMLRHFYSIKKEVEVDECPSCGGIWLDAGELCRIRAQYPTEEQRREAARAYFHEVFAQDFFNMKERNEERRRKARKIANTFRFLCPSYYLPGKQKWGAF